MSFDPAPRPANDRARATLSGIDWESSRGMAHLRGFNYQPSWGHDAASIWLENFDRDRYGRELARGLEAFPSFNCVRIWLGYGAHRQRPDQLARNFHDAVDICAELGLIVIPVLFTVWAGFPPFDPIDLEQLAPERFSDFDQYLADIVGGQAGNETILAWDLCNEPIGETAAVALAATSVQRDWLSYVHDKVKALDPGCRTCIGTVLDAGWEGVAEHCTDFVTPHIYGYPLWVRSDRQVDFATWFEVITSAFVARTELQREGVPILVTETGWGAAGDQERVDILQASLPVLQRLGLGYLAHALWTSGVADLHPPVPGETYPGRLLDPKSMAFLDPDGSVRPGHDLFNR